MSGARLEIVMACRTATFSACAAGIFSGHRERIRTSVSDQLPTLNQLSGMMVAILGGAAVGLERERSGHAIGPRARFGGLRTFTLLGVIAGVAGFLIASDRGMAGALLVAGAIGLVVAAYSRASLRDVDATTEVAALVVLAAGVLSGTGGIYLGAGLTTVTVMLLAEKPTLHALARRLDDTTLVAAARFAVMAIVILPLLPVGPFGPAPGVKPRELWLLVLLFSALSFIGFIFRRLFGTRGYLVAGLLGGLVSSTSVTLTLARLSRTHTRDAAAMAGGALAASTVLFARVATVIAVLDVSLLPLALWYLAPAFAAGAVSLLFLQRSSGNAEPVAGEMKNPLEFRAAIEMAVLFQAVLFGVHAAQAFIGSLAVLVSGFLLGLTDVDALTLAMVRNATALSPALATRAIAVGVLANTLLKAAVAIAIGNRHFSKPALLGLAAIAAVLGIMLVIG
jgi:uncharacterized membrane protein (DUF4010 family)